MEQSIPHGHTFQIVQTISKTRVTVHEASYDLARDWIERNLDDDLCLGEGIRVDTQILPCCSSCLKAFPVEEASLSFGMLEEIDPFTPYARLICSSCVDQLDAQGQLIECPHCGDLFSSDILQNIAKGEACVACPDCSGIIELRYPE